jgi:hypothetical protein
MDRPHRANGFQKQFSVLLFGSHPDEENDDCWSGAEFDTEAEARACLDNPWATFERGYFAASTAFIVLDGASLPDLVIKTNPGFRPNRSPGDRIDGEWKREAAMQAGMVFGCQGYNDEMGW